MAVLDRKFVAKVGGVIATKFNYTAATDTKIGQNSKSAVVRPRAAASQQSLRLSSRKTQSG